MKTIYLFFIKLVLRKPLIFITSILLMLMFNYTIFSASRTILSTLQGYQHTSSITLPDIYIANLDPESDIDIESISDRSIQSIYDYLDNNHKYAFYSDGYITDISNHWEVEVPVSYINQEFNDLNGFSISVGSGLNFDYNIDDQQPITALVGKGLADDYPIGSIFTINDPAIHEDITIQVVGILEENASRSNYYALDSKQYYNFSIVLPIAKSFIKKADIPFKINGLMDLIITQTSEAEVLKLEDFINHSIKSKFNFYSQYDNIEYHNKYFLSSMIMLSMLSSIFLIFIVLITTWNSLVGLKLMISPLTINILLGLSYKRVKHLFYGYYSALSIFLILLIISFIAFSRYEAWINKDSYLITFGYLGGLISIDWFAFLITTIFNIFLILLLVEIILWRLKKIPISMGVLQQ